MTAERRPTRLNITSTYNEDTHVYLLINIYLGFIKFVAENVGRNIDEICTSPSIFKETDRYYKTYYSIYAIGIESRRISR
jgi:hypothetical protein